MKENTVSRTKNKYYKEPKDKRQFIVDMYPIAVETEVELKRKGYSIHVLAILTMVALESSWGEDAVGNMYFEKRADEGDKNRQLVLRRRLHDSGDYVGYPKIIKILPLADGKYKYIVKEWFRKYEKSLDNIMEHYIDIVMTPEYSEAVELGSNPRLFIKKLAEAGYTYNKRYEKEMDYNRQAILVMSAISRNLPILLPLQKLAHYPHTPDECIPASSSE